MEEVSKFGMHSIKSGTAFNPAYGRIPGDLLDIHAGGSVLLQRVDVLSTRNTYGDCLNVSTILLLEFNCSRPLQNKIGIYWLFRENF